MGLLGGSFNPAHAGHRHIAELALRRLRLDQVWLLVSPGNPLKRQHGMATLSERLRSAAAIADGRRIIATGIEATLRTRYTVDTLRALRRRFPCVRFVWLMGADNLVQLPDWRGWLDIVRTTPFAVLPRPTYTQRALAGQAAHQLRAARIPGRLASALAGMAPPAWVLLTVPLHNASATAIRAAQPETSTIARKPPAPPSPPDPPLPPKPAASPRKRATASRPAGGAAKVAVTTPAQPGTPRKKAAVAGPKPRAARETAEPSRLDQLQHIIMASLEDDKAEQPVALDLAGRAAFADRMVIATGLADRQIAAMATHLEDRLHEAGLKRIQVEGANGSDWVLIDAGDIVIHLFKPEARALYALERMWGAELDEPTPAA